MYCFFVLLCPEYNITIIRFVSKLVPYINDTSNQNKTCYHVFITVCVFCISYKIDVPIIFSLWKIVYIVLKMFFFYNCEESYSVLYKMLLYLKKCHWHVTKIFILNRIIIFNILFCIVFQIFLICQQKLFTIYKQVW